MPRALKQCENDNCRTRFRPRPERGDDAGRLCAGCRDYIRWSLKQQKTPTVAVSHVGDPNGLDRRALSVKSYHCGECGLTWHDGRTSCDHKIGPNFDMTMVTTPLQIEDIDDFAVTPQLPPPRRTCGCGSSFVVPLGQPDTTRCADCRRRVSRPREENPYDGFLAGAALPQAKVGDLLPPLRVAVFDLETFALDRGWGVTMVGSILIHGGLKPSIQTFTLRNTASWRAGKRSIDAELGALILKELHGCDILIAHNGKWFDVPWLNSVALKYGMPRLGHKKLVDPVQIGRKTYRLGERGGNSLGSMAQFLGLEEEKMPVPREVWRRALLDDSAEDWQTLQERCESDVRLLNAVAGRVMGDAGMIDYSGSARR